MKNKQYRRFRAPFDDDIICETLVGVGSSVLECTFSNRAGHFCMSLLLDSVGIYYVVFGARISCLFELYLLIVSGSCI